MFLETKKTRGGGPIWRIEKEKKQQKKRGILWRKRPQQKQQHTQNNCKFAVTLGVRPSQAKPSQANPSQAQPTPAQPSSARLSPARNNEINHIYKYKEISKNANWPTSHKCPYVFGNEKNKGWWADLTDWERKKRQKKRGILWRRASGSTFIKIDHFLIKDQLRNGLQSSRLDFDQNVLFLN